MAFLFANFLKSSSKTFIISKTSSRSKCPPSALILSSCRNMSQLSISKRPRDPSSLSNYHNWRTLKTTVDVEINFDEQILSGSVRHNLLSLTNAESKEIILDTSYVTVKQVKFGGQDVSFTILPRLEPFGSALKIPISNGVAENVETDLEISFSTTEQCTALQWLAPAQTSNKKHGYLFSQSQAIHARSIFPCQDTPDVKAPFDFVIRSKLPVVASGVADKSNPDSIDESGTVKEYTFRQSQPIPSYLFAIASGDIASAPVGPRSRVFTGPDEVKACQWEFEEDTEKQLKAAESIVFPYQWGEYNVLVLPPSFPYGGMENPVSTFLTPTVVSGDRQNIDVVAHELSHSWSGNLVSNCSWEHFWLNEGWTTYLERRILAVMHGHDDRWRDFSAIIGWSALVDSISAFGEDHEFTKLIVDLKGKDPDDAFSSVPYEKGFVFLYHLEKLLGKSKFDTFIPHYFKTWSGKSLDSYEFRATIQEFFAGDEAASKKLKDLDWDTWFYKPGLPTKPDFDTSLVDSVYALADKWTAFTADTTIEFKPQPDDIKDWSANQIVIFLERILSLPKPLPTEQAQQMGETYSLRETKNVEVSSRFFQVALAAGDSTVKGLVTDMLGNVGRMKFVRPLYRSLIAYGDVDLAVETFEKNKDFYHPICREMVRKMILGKTNRKA